MNLTIHALLAHLIVCTVVTHGQKAAKKWPIGVVEKLHTFGSRLMKNRARDKSEIAAKIKEASTQIKELQGSLKMVERTILNEIDRLLNYHQIMHELKTSGTYIDNMFRRFELYDDDTTYEDSTLKDFAQSSTSHSKGHLLSMMNLIYRLVNPVGNDNKGLFDLIMKDKTTKLLQITGICNKTESPQQTAFLLYNLVSFYMIKGSVIRLYSYEMLKELGLGHYNTEIAGVRLEYDKFMKNIGLRVKETMKTTSRDIRPCDAKIHKEGETYLQLKWLFGSMYTNEIFLSVDKNCGKSCSDYTKADFHPNNFPGRPERCYGSLYRCFSEDSDYYCEATVPYRRYSGIPAQTLYGMYGEKTIAARGNVTDCKKKELVPDEQRVPPQKVGDSYDYCNECVCSCDDYNHPETVRTFSLREVSSDTDENMVITGVRFVEAQKVFHIQIQQGKLLPDGTIDVKTITWKPVDEFDYRDPSVPTSDYYTVTALNNAVALARFEMVNGKVMAGVRLAKRHSMLTVEMKTCSMHNDYLSGCGHWLISRRHSKQRVPIAAPHISTLTKSENIMNYAPNKYIKFSQTNWTKDASQTAVPFLDAQPVVSNPPMPLGGIGLYYKGQEGYGGFLGLYLISLDYARFIETESDISIEDYDFE